MKKLSIITAVISTLIVTAVVFNSKKNIDEKDLISDAFSACEAGSDRSTSILCFKKALEKKVIKYGIGQFIEAVSGMFATSDPVPITATQCHDILHAIGQVGGADSNSKDINKTVVQCSNICTFGCFHGVAEGYLMKGGDIASEISKLCLIEGDDTGQLRSPCYHGLGHGVASIAGYNFIKALTMCDLIPEERYKIDCGSGVIMELYEPGSFGHAQLEWPADIPEFCNTLPYPYSMVCYTTAGLHEYGRSQNPQKAFKTCEAVPQDLNQECNISIGRNFYYVFQGSSPQITKACKNSNEAVFLGCVQGAISASFAIDSRSQKSYEICGQLEDKLKNKCSEFLK